MYKFFAFVEKHQTILGPAGLSEISAVSASHCQCTEDPDILQMLYWAAEVSGSTYCPCVHTVMYTSSSCQKKVSDCSGTQIHAHNYILTIMHTFITHSLIHTFTNTFIIIIHTLITPTHSCIHQHIFITTAESCILRFYPWVVQE